MTTTSSSPTTTSTREPSDRLEAARDGARDSTAVEGIARAGLVARGLMYCVVALLALQIAWGDRRDDADREGAFEAIARQPFGRALLLALVAGFAAYAVWRLVQVFVVDEENLGKRWAKRVAFLGRAGIYAAGAYTALRLATSSSNGSRDGQSGEEERAWTARLLEWPAGRALVIGVGLAVIGYGLWNGYRALQGKWKKKLDLHEASPTTRAWATRVAAVGLGARMVIFLLVGVFLIQAAWQYDPSEAVGVDGALRRLADRAWGTWLLVAVALGLLAYGLYSFVEARYRRVPEE